MGRNGWAVRWAKCQSVNYLERFARDKGRVWEKHPERLSERDRVRLSAVLHVLKQAPDPRLPDITD